MRHTLRTLLLLALGGVVVAAAAYGAVHHRHHRHHRVVRDAGRLGPALFGFNDNSVLFQQTDPESAIQRSLRAGANVIRYSVNWDYVEPHAGQFNWHGYDPLYEAAIRHGIRPILIPVFSPHWARPLDLSCGAAAADHCEDPPALKYDNAWANFVAQLANRYPKAAAIEVWNEPNLINFWKQGPDPQRYADLLNVAYDAVKKAQPDMRVLGGALSNTESGGNGSAPYEQYLNDLLGYKPKFDAFSIHDYDTAGGDSDWFDKTLDIARSALDLHGFTDVPLWVTEIGRSTEGERAVSPAAQATRLANMLKTLGGRKGVQAALVHTMIPAPTGPQTEEYGFAVMNADGTPKPAFCLLAAGRRALSIPACKR
jgi:hypothetical protein